MKYFVLYEDPDTVSPMREGYDVTFCSLLATLDRKDTVDALLQADKRLISPCFARNQEAVEIGARVIEILRKNGRDTSIIEEYFRNQAL